ncbi:MAG: hypothetical protein JXA10_08825 [Anaerolineae bacterium]|nr:hypothetical protein [Anaerolineae bacterium]
MTEQPDFALIGKVLRASTTGFVCGTRSENISQPAFGAFVRTWPGQRTDIDVIGIIHAISIDDDPMVRQMILANNMRENTISDQRVNRMVPVEISVLSVGFFRLDRVYHTLPPQPPLSLDPVRMCDADTVHDFTENLDFLRLVVNASDVPTEELLAAAINHAAWARPAEEQRAFRVRAGRHLAGLLSHDLPRLQHLLKLIRPV